ncbi:hypothetical protein BS50DRAFT_349022 [Corynespora cassiicola Philippines]|uniref:Uncharacterized protein n=1 Tax=Corynespora cassiicola Philippines TaxID=1448308 RepID=A0A2T2NQU9_CORCC|nr:hypothetical protein BS50DRAFT_349022 [Corynespora cassiicola Philippines]
MIYNSILYRHAHEYSNAIDSDNHLPKPLFYAQRKKNIRKIPRLTPRATPTDLHPNIASPRLIPTSQPAHHRGKQRPIHKENGHGKPKTDIHTCNKPPDPQKRPNWEVPAIFSNGQYSYLPPIHLYARNHPRPPKQKRPRRPTLRPLNSPSIALHARLLAHPPKARAAPIPAWSLPTTCRPVSATAR